MGGAKELAVLIGGNVAGTLRQGKSGEMSYRYESSYSGPELSVSMPFTGSIYGDRKARPFFAGVLPEDVGTLKALGSRYGISPANPFSLLEHIGLDLPGALQVCQISEIDSARSQRGSLVPVDDEQIGAKLKAVAKGEKSWIADKEHWSLGGAQSKFALRNEDGKWYVCEGAQATTHILKPGIADLNFQALDEHISLGAARRLGLDVEKTEYLEFDGVPAIVAQRYDRIAVDGIVQRIHQEDLCQATGTFPEKKYTKDGGPGPYEIIDVLKATGVDAAENVESFIDALFYNYLIAGTDAHAKNYSLLHFDKRLVLAPLYDVASYFPYAEGRWGDIDVAMPIGREKRICRIGYRNLERFCEAAKLEDLGITPEDLTDDLLWMCEELPSALERELSESSSIVGIDELANRLLPKVAKSCEFAQARLEASVPTKTARTQGVVPKVKAAPDRAPAVDRKQETADRSLERDVERNRRR